MNLLYNKRFSTDALSFSLLFYGELHSYFILQQNVNTRTHTQPPWEIHGNRVKEFFLPEMSQIDCIERSEKCDKQISRYVYIQAAWYLFVYTI